MPSNRLSEEQKRFIIRGHAEFMNYAEIRAEFQEKYGRVITRNRVAYYDPRNSACGGPGKKWVDYFRICRDASERDLGKIPVASHIIRLRKLNRLVERFSVEAMAGDEKAAGVVLRGLRLAAELTGGIQTKMAVDVTKREIVEIRDESGIGLEGRVAVFQSLLRPDEAPRLLAAAIGDVDRGGGDESGGAADALRHGDEVAANGSGVVVVGRGASSDWRSRRHRRVRITSRRSRRLPMHSSPATR